MTDQYKCPSYYDDDNILRDCTCGKCGETTPQDWREEAVDEIVDEHPWIYRLEEALVNEDKYHYCEVDATDLKFTIKHYRRLQNLLTSRDTYWKEMVLAILEDVLDREYQKRNPPKKHNYLESFMWDIHKAFMKDITNEDNLK